MRFDDDLPEFLSDENIERARLVWRAILLVALIAGLLAASARLAHAQEPSRGIVNAAIAAQGASFVVEMYSTEACLQRAGCRELNHLVPSGTSKGETITRGLIKAGGATVSTWLLLRARDRHPTLVVVTSIGIAAFNGYLTKRALDHYDPPRR